MTIGENIKKFRNEKGITQRELGEKLNITQQMIGQYESGGRNPKLETIRKIAEALEIYMNDLIGDNWNSFSSEEIQNDFSDKVEDNTVALPQSNILRDDLLRFYDKLNSKGQVESVKRISELTRINEYTE